MTNRYYLDFEARCPVNGNTDFYHNCCIEVPADRVILCEDIAKYLRSFAKKKVFQEALTKRIAKKFKARVQLECTHYPSGVFLVSEWDATNEIPC